MHPRPLDAYYNNLTAVLIALRDFMANASQSPLDRGSIQDGTRISHGAKFEIRNPNSESSSKFQARRETWRYETAASDFDIRICFEFRISNFGFRKSRRYSEERRVPERLENLELKRLRSFFLRNLAGLP